MRPYVIFLFRLFGFLPPIRTWHCLCLYYCCCFLSFRFHYLPHWALYLYLFLVPCKQNIQISRHVMFYNLSYRYVRVCVHTYLFFIATVYKYIWISHVGIYICILLLCCFLAIWRLLLVSFIPVVVVLEFYSGSTVGFCFLPFASIGHLQGMQFYVCST